ncbi:hypothetical protein BST28_22860, partial [Mycolicibacter kumamotonensis]
MSSFGISGTNAHVIIEEPPTPENASTNESPVVAELPVVPLLASARSEQALTEQITRLQAVNAPPLDVAFTAATTRTHLEHRAVVLPRATITGRTDTGRTAIMFTGQGAQRINMGAGLHEVFPVFAHTFDQCCTHFDDLLGPGLRDALTDPDTLDHTQWTQPALFSLEVALYRLTESLGIQPDYLIGHSIGELAAAHIAGVWSLQDACTFVAARARLMGSLPPGGAMMSVTATTGEITPLLPETVAIAAVNAPRSLVLSGPAAELDALQTQLTDAGLTTRRLHVSHAFHSPLMEPILTELHQTATTLTYSPPQIPIISNLTGAILTDTQATSPDYWVNHVRQTVHFAQGITTLTDAGVTHYLELGPDPVLCTLTPDNTLAAPALRRRRDDTETFLTMLAHAHTHGVNINWTTLFAGRGATKVDLPTYPFEHRTYWLTP